MTWNTAIKWIMLVSGVLTLTMLQAAIAPDAAMRTTFGDAPDGVLAEIVVRNWGVLIGLVGAMLIYGAYHPAVRALVLVVAGVSKLAFIGLVLLYGRQYLATAGLSIGIDGVMVALFIAYLIATRRAFETPSLPLD
jgi:hypothetical protein